MSGPVLVPAGEGRCLACGAPCDPSAIPACDPCLRSRQGTGAGATFHAIDYSAPQDGIAFRTENAILTLLWLREFEGFPREVRHGGR